MDYTDFINEAMQERQRLQMQQEKDDYIAMQESRQGSQQQAAPTIPGLEDPYAQYLYENREELKNPEYAALTREEFGSYGPPVRVGTGGYEVLGKTAEAAPPAVAEMAATMPKQAPSTRQAQQAPQAQPQTLRQMIDAMPFAGDRYEAERKSILQFKRDEINKLNAYGDMMSQNGYSMNDVQKFIEIKQKQIDANFEVPEPIEKTQAFAVSKAAVSDGKFLDKMMLIANLKAISEEARKIKDPDQQIIFLTANSQKLINSIAAGADAIQPSERSDISPELRSIWENPANALQLISAKGFWKAGGKQPLDYLNKIDKLYNASIRPINEILSKHENNLGSSAFKSLGIARLTEAKAANIVTPQNLQNIRAGISPSSPIFEGDRKASNGPQIIPNMRGTAVPSGFSYGAQPSYGQKQGEGF